MDTPPPASARQRLLARHPWLIFILPLAVFMLVTSLEPTPKEEVGADRATSESHAAEESVEAAPSRFALNIPYRWYPAVYTVKIVLVFLAVAFVWPGYREFPFRLSPLAFLVGVAGVVVWIGLWKLDLESRLGLRELTDMFGRRSGFNPLVELAGQPGWAWGFLAIRLAGLALVVPLIEEMFLRGFLMRYFVAAEWWNAPIGQVNRAAFAAAIVVPVLMHPGELFAATVWFAGIAWLVVKTRNIWDCVVAHAVTNALLGLYVLTSGDPQAWQLM